MILSNFKVFPRVGRLVGIDWGLRRTGVAVSDESREFVFARAPIVSDTPQDLLNAILHIVNSEKIVGIVIGLPLRMDGTESETTARVRAFADALAHETDTPIIFIDETLSSSEAQGQMGRVRVRDIKEKLDSNAARVILENAIALVERRV
jgi:putative Holliday junction resolvase